MIKFTTVIVAHVCKYPISLANGAYIINDVRLLSNPLVFDLFHLGELFIHFIDNAADQIQHFLGTAQ